jgi:hypothetical protein
VFLTRIGVSGFDTSLVIFVKLGFITEKIKT